MRLSLLVSGQYDVTCISWEEGDELRTSAYLLFLFSSWMINQDSLQGFYKFIKMGNKATPHFSSSDYFLPPEKQQLLFPGLREF